MKKWQVLKEKGCMFYIHFNFGTLKKLKSQEITARVNVVFSLTPVEVPNFEVSFVKSTLSADTTNELTHYNGETIIIRPIGTRYSYRSNQMAHLSITKALLN